MLSKLLELSLIVELPKRNEEYPMTIKVNYQKIFQTEPQPSPKY